MSGLAHFSLFLTSYLPLFFLIILRHSFFIIKEEGKTKGRAEALPISRCVGMDYYLKINLW